MNNATKIIITSFQPFVNKKISGGGKLGFELFKKAKVIFPNSIFIVSYSNETSTFGKIISVSAISRLFFFLLRNLNKFFLFKVYHYRFIQELFFDFFCQFRITKDAGVLISTNPFMPFTFKRAKKLGLRTILIPPNPEERAIANILNQEAQRLKIDSVKDPYTYIRRLKYYEGGLKYIDKIIGTSSVIFDTYTILYKNVELQKAIYMAPEIIDQNIIKAYNPGHFVFGYLAHSVLLKGLHNLVEAWSEMDNNCFLLIGGNIDESILPLIRKKISEGKNRNIRILGNIPSVEAFLRDLDWFICPSLIDGGPVTVIESLLAGTPAIISNQSGIKDIFLTNDFGHIAENNGSESIFKILDYIVSNNDKRCINFKSLGEILKRYSLSEFSETLVKSL